jgi:hypothetical protein
MVHTKFAAHPIKPIVSSDADSMASDEALEAFVQQRETSTEATSSHGADSDCESQSGNSGDSKIASDNSGHLKVLAVAALAGISYDFGPSGVMKARIGSMENYARYFPKGYGRAPGAESVSEPQANNAIVFDDFFTTGLRMPPGPVLADILCKF